MNLQRDNYEEAEMICKKILENEPGNKVLAEFKAMLPGEIEEQRVLRE
jgi:hypothetical protein